MTRVKGVIMEIAGKAGSNLGSHKESKEIRALKLDILQIFLITQMKSQIFLCCNCQLVGEIQYESMGY